MLGSRIVHLTWECWKTLYEELDHVICALFDWVLDSDRRGRILGAPHARSGTLHYRVCRDSAGHWRGHRRAVHETQRSELADSSSLGDVEDLESWPFTIGSWIPRQL